VNAPAPTPLRTGLAPALCTNVFAAIVFAPLIRETVPFAGRVIINVLFGSPATVNDAATPAAGGTRAGPTAVLELSVPRTTVPAVPVVAIVPKFMSLTLVSASGPTIVAVAVVGSVSVDCAKVPAVKAISIAENKRIFFIISVFKVDIKLFILFLCFENYYAKHYYLMKRNI
jgi:hypothetical protein